MQVFLALQSGKKLMMEVNKYSTVADLKRKLHLITGNKEEFMHLVFFGKELPNDKTLRACNVASKRFILVIYTVPGGG